MRGEMAQGRSLMSDSEPPERLPSVEALRNDFDDIVDVALRVDPTGDGQTHEFHPCGDESPRGVIGSKHDATDFYRPDTACTVELDDERLSG